MNGEQTIEALKNLEQGIAKNMHQDMKNLTAYLSWFSPSFIRSPIKAVFLNSSSDKSKLLISDSKGNLALLKRHEKETACQRTMKNLRILSLEVPNDRDYFIIGDKSGTVYKLDINTLDVLENYNIGDKGISCLLTYKHDEYLIGSVSGEFFHLSLAFNEKPKKIFNFGSEITALACSNTYSAVGTLKGIAEIYTSGLNHQAQYDLGVEITSLKFISDHFAVAFGNEVRVLHCQTGEQLFQFSTHRNKINCMTVLDDLLITGSADNTLKVWRTDRWSEEVTLFGHSAPVLGITIIDNIIHSLDSEGSIRVSRIPNFPNSDKFQLADRVKNIIYSQKLGTNLCIMQTGSVLSLKTCGLIHETSLNSPVICTSFTRNSDVLVVFQEKEKKSCHVSATLIELSSQIKTNFVLRTSSLPQACASTESLNYLITGEMFRITIWRAVDGIQEYIFCTHNTHLTSIICLGLQFFASDANGVTRHYRLDTFESLETFNELDEKPVKILSLTPDSRHLFVLTMENTLRVWDLNRKITAFEVNFEATVNKIEFQPDSSHFFVAMRKEIQVWSCESRTKHFVLAFTEKIFSLSVNPVDKKLVCVFEDHYQVLDNPFDARIVTVYGKFQSNHLFLEHLHQIFKGFKPKFQKEFNNFVIEPFHINLLHVYSYFNLSGHIEQALKSGSSCFPSRLFYDPIQISLEKHHLDSLKSLITNLIPILKSSPSLFSYISNSIVQLNYLSPSMLNQIYESSLILSQDSSVPHFCKENINLPIISLSPDSTLTVHQAVPRSLEEERRAVDFYQSFLPLNYTTGSRESVEFLKSLVACKQLEIFNTLFLRVLLNYKWKKVRWVHLVDWVLYVVYMICLTLGVFSHDLHYLLFASFAVNQILFVYEFAQMVAGPRIYFHSFVNYIDFLRGVLFNIYCVLEYINLYEEHQNKLFLITLFISIFRAYGYFRIFKSTRWLIYLVLEIVYQLWSFIIVATYMILSLWILNFAVENTIDLSHLSEIKLNIMLFFFILIVNPIVIINLFINIVGNALEKIQDEKEVKDLQEVAEMIFEAESMMFWRRNNKGKSFFQVCLTEQESFAKIDDSVTDKINKASETVELIKGLSFGEKRALEELKVIIEQSFDEIEQKVKAMGLN